MVLPSATRLRRLGNPFVPGMALSLIKSKPDFSTSSVAPKTSAHPRETVQIVPGFRHYLQNLADCQRFWLLRLIETTFDDLSVGNFMLGAY